MGTVKTAGMDILKESIGNLVGTGITKVAEGDQVAHLNWSVMIGIVGDLKGHLVLKGDIEFFRGLGLHFYGMELSDEMILSFIGEFGNMVAGSWVTLYSTEGVMLDITPPTVIENADSVYVMGEGENRREDWKLEDKGTLGVALYLQ